jgi:hypothetical protein
MKVFFVKAQSTVLLPNNAKGNENAFFAPVK